MPTTKDDSRLARLVERINSTSNADFVRRLLDARRKTLRNADGTVSTHELGYVTSGDGAIVFPQVQSAGDSLARFPYPESLERAIARGDTLMMSVPDAELFTKGYKDYYPGFGDYGQGGGLARAFGYGTPGTVVPVGDGSEDDGDSKETGHMQRSPEGGYTTSTEKREEVNKNWDPTTGFGPFGWWYSTSHGNQSHGEENEYWRAYLGLNNNLPRMNPAAKTGWDDAVEAQKAADGELASDFYGTTPRMDQMIQVVADTLNTGNILRNYDSYKAANPKLAPKGVIKHLYEQGKKVMENPDAWTQVKEGPQLYLYDELDASTNEKMPLGMLADFGMMWSPSEGALRVHDTYDFPGYVTALSSIPKRPKEMKIRGLVKYDPKKGSVLLRDGLDKSKQAKPVATKGSH